jgi:hypothetical protein
MLLSILRARKTYEGRLAIGEDLMSFAIWTSCRVTTRPVRRPRR